VWADAGTASVYEAFRRSASSFASRPLLREPDNTGGPRADWTYARAASEVDALRSRYAAAGVAAGGRVALAFDSRVDVYLHLLALNGLGISLVPLNTGGSDSELAYVIEHSRCSLVVSLEEHAGRLRALAASHGLCRVVPADELGASAAAEAPAVPALSEREAALLYTSGTTGQPKGCMLSNEYFLALGRWYNALGGRCALDEHDRLLTPLPPNHMNALCVSFMAMLLCGGCVVQLDRFHPSTWWQTVRSERASIIHYLGVMPAILLKLPPAGDENFARQVKFGFGAGSDPRHQVQFERRFGFPLLEAWSMTETGAGAVSIADREPRHVGQRCIGRMSPATEYRIVDEAGDAVEAGEPGELLVRALGPDPGKGFFSGYFADEEATREAWKGGWFHTGDIVREGDDGSLFFVDRRKNVIRRSGENIAAVEVEATLLGHPKVVNCAVTAVPDELRGDEVFAFIVPAKPCGAGDARALVDYCLERLSYFKAPGYVAFVDELPLTASQKISRGAVKTAARDCVARSACFDLRDAKKRRPRREAG
jgi:acyl-CoA synthetase (AMP-forming)/AMP-acid ligase II